VVVIKEEKNGEEEENKEGKKSRQKEGNKSPWSWRITREEKGSLKL